ncbi:hypothetical protein NTH33_004038 [Vibrio mimicus]
MSGLIYIVCAICFNVIAQVLIKYSSDKIYPISITNIYVYNIILAVLFYMFSFALTVKIYSVNSISIISPIMAGMTILLITLSGVFVFSESLKATQIIGVFFTVLGVAFLSNK